MDTPAQKLLLLSFPVLLVLALLEAMLYPRLRGAAFDWREAGTSLGLALGHHVSKLLFAGSIGAAVAFTWEHRLTTIEMAPWVWPVLFLFVEFVYYWQHRFSHEVRWLWASHSVHHSPEQLTLSAAYRLAWTGAFSGTFIFFLVPILVGFSPPAVFGMLSLNLLFQFGLHTELVRTLGPLEYVFNTPSHHRVHHASNAEYLDKNYGGVLIVFDRLFGTFAREEATCRYGLTKPVGSRTPWGIAFHEWVAMWVDVRGAKTWRERAGFLFGRPGWSAGERFDAALLRTEKGSCEVLAPTTQEHAARP